MEGRESEVELELKQLVPMIRYLDLKVLSVSRGLYKVLVPLSENTKNHFNTVHAAVQWASSEALGGMIAFPYLNSDTFVVVVRNVSIKFKRPAYSDITSEAHFSVERHTEMRKQLLETGRYDFNIDIITRNLEGDIVSEAQGSYAIRKVKEKGKL
mmetsp:Transcript_2642/g.2990  ORF Transcript_2642/g.2990 Transcript_2642/m.2990 type:complete len:155 (+) Transcript_2642:465-929(+)